MSLTTVQTSSFLRPLLIGNHAEAYLAESFVPTGKTTSQACWLP
jgi:hypothetical protein